MHNRVVRVLASLLILASSAWGSTERVLYTFTNGTDGGIPINSGQLVFDQSGNLYGTTELGGDCGNGTVFQLTPGNPQWTETVLHSFCGAEGFYPLCWRHLRQSRQPLWHDDQWRHFRRRHGV